MTGRLEVTILGASGYTGVGLFTLCAAHPGLDVVAVSAERHAGERLAGVFPRVAGLSDLTLLPAKEALETGADVVFSCLPHTASMALVPEALAKGAKVLDLSADFRMSSAESYEQWYGHEHTAPHLLSERAYGMPELHRDAIRKARLVAVPGCYPTSVQLGLAPLAEAGLIDLRSIIVDSKSGVSGAGRKLSLRTHFVETNENFAPYNVGRVHRHVGEMEQELSRMAGGQEARVIFTPHLVPMNQGILSSMYVELTAERSEEQLMDLYRERYGGERFVRVVDHLPETAFVRDTNYVDVSVRTVEGTNRAMVFCAVDNLVKGAYGQALQAMNVMCGFDESLGLPV